MEITQQTQQKPTREIRQYDDTKIFAAIAFLFAGFLLLWNIASQAAAIYKLHLDADSCKQVRTLGMEPTDNCMISAPYRPLGIAPGGYLTLPSGNDLQITPLEATPTRETAPWSFSMKVQLWIALLCWAVTLGLLISAFYGKKSSN